jgi:hypothetical protein
MYCCIGCRHPEVYRRVTGSAGRYASTIRQIQGLSMTLADALLWASKQERAMKSQWLTSSKLSFN